MKKILISFIFVFFISYVYPKTQKTIIMIDPAGSVSDIGRKLVEGYERGATLKFAERIQKKLEEKYNVRVILTRSPGEEILPFQNASFANRLHADFFIRLHLYREDSIKPKIALYHLVFDSLVDFAKRNIDPLTFFSVYQSHFAHIHKTKALGDKVYEYLNLQLYKKYFDCVPLSGIPLRHLVGVQAPSIVIECGISHDEQWVQLVEPLCDSLRPSILV